MTDLERVARAIWEHYPEKLPAWDNLNDGYTPSQACFRKMAQAALDAMASRPAGMREALERIAMGSPRRLTKCLIVHDIGVKSER